MRTVSNQSKKSVAFKCPKCDFLDPDKRLIKKHLKDVHKAPPFSCPHCNVGFSNFAKLQAHVKADHIGFDVPKEPYIQVLPDTLKQYFAQQVTTDFKESDGQKVKKGKSKNPTATQSMTKSVAKPSKSNSDTESKTKISRLTPEIKVSYERTETQNADKIISKTEETKYNSEAKNEVKSTFEKPKVKVDFERTQNPDKIISKEPSKNEETKYKEAKNEANSKVNTKQVDHKESETTTKTVTKPPPIKAGNSKVEDPHDVKKVIPPHSTAVKPKVESVPLSERSAYVQQAQEAALELEKSGKSQVASYGFTSKLKQLWTNLTTQQ